jgi:hypothetical protein
MIRLLVACTKQAIQLAGEKKVSWIADRGVAELACRRDSPGTVREAVCFHGNFTQRQEQKRVLFRRYKILSHAMATARAGAHLVQTAEVSITQEFTGGRARARARVRIGTRLVQMVNGSMMEERN